jgi:hypothetical protein
MNRAMALVVVLVISLTSHFAYSDESTEKPTFQETFLEAVFPLTREIWKNSTMVPNNFAQPILPLDFDWPVKEVNEEKTILDRPRMDGFVIASTTLTNNVRNFSR